MSDMYFDASERIAEESDFPRAEIAEIDRFLARKHLREIKLQDVRDCVSDRKLAEQILDAYIKQKVVQNEERFYCPKHEHTVLKRPKCPGRNKKGLCEECGERYALREMDSETIFVRVKEPDRPSLAETDAARENRSVTENVWWADKKWLVERVFQFIIIVVMLSSLAFNAYTFHVSRF